MQQLNLQKAPIWVLHSDLAMRTEIRLLINEQNGHAIEFGKLNSLASSLKNEMPAALLTAVDGATEGVIHLISRMRVGEIGKNPFLPTIAITGDDSDAQWKRLTNAGFNLILYSPFSRQNIWNVVNQLYKDNRNFIVTKEYVGPQRYVDNKLERLPPHTTPVPVPNALEGAVSGNPVKGEVLKAAFDMVTEERVKNAAFMTLAKFETAIQNPNANPKEVATTVAKLCNEALKGIQMTSLAAAKGTFELSREFAQSVADHGFSKEDRLLSLELCEAMSNTVLENQPEPAAIADLHARVRERIQKKTGG